MNWEDTPEEAEFRAAVRSFVTTHFPASYRPDPEAEHSLEPEDVWGYNWAADRRSPDPARREGALAWAAALAERGWIAPHWPKEYGGAGLSAKQEFVLQEEMMKARVPTVNGIGAFLIGPTILELGTDEQKAAHLPPIARGETTWAQGFSEPESGSDLASLRTRAVRDGDHYVVNGQKVWTSLGVQADWLFVLVRTDGGVDSGAPKHKGITFLLVDTTTPGVTVRPITDIRGDAPFAEVFFDDARVPVANRVGDENRGWYVAMTALGFERSGIGATVKFEQALSTLVDYLRSEEGRAHARPDTAGLRLEIARRYTEVRVLYNLARHSASSGDYAGSVSQLFGAELHQRLARTGAKAFGHLAELWQREGAPLGAAFTHLRLDSVAATFLGGTTEIQRNVIATRGLGLPRS